MNKKITHSLPVRYFFEESLLRDYFEKIIFYLILLSWNLYVLWIMLNIRWCLFIESNYFLFYSKYFLFYMIMILFRLLIRVFFNLIDALLSIQLLYQSNYLRIVINYFHSIRIVLIVVVFQT